jgi:hypothetical protein
LIVVMAGQLDWRWAALTAAVFVLLQNLLDKDVLACAQVIALCALAVAFPLLVLATVEIHTIADEDKRAEASYVLTIGLAGSFCLLIAITALLWHLHWAAAVLFGITVLLGVVVSKVRFSRRSLREKTAVRK